MPENVANLLGTGEYKNAISSFKQHHGDTPDSILIKENALLTMYDQPDFNGSAGIKRNGATTSLL